MPSKLISELTADTNPDSQSLVPVSLPTGGTRRVTLSNLRKRPVGEPMLVIEGTNGCAGLATLVAGTVTVNTTAVTANTRILLTAQEAGTLNGNLRISARVAGTSFTISSTDSGDTASVAWLFQEPAF